MTQEGIQGAMRGGLLTQIIKYSILPLDKESIFENKDPKK
jgi:hypothetical protein